MPAVFHVMLSATLSNFNSFCLANSSLTIDALAPESTKIVEVVPSITTSAKAAPLPTALTYSLLSFNVSFIAPATFIFWTPCPTPYCSLLCRSMLCFSPCVARYVPNGTTCFISAVSSSLELSFSSFFFEIFLLSSICVNLLVLLLLIYIFSTLFLFAVFNLCTDIPLALSVPKSFPCNLWQNGRFYYISEKSSYLVLASTYHTLV